MSLIFALDCRWLQSTDRDL